MINFLRNLFFRDFLLKLFSLVLAVLIWTIVSLAIRREVSPMAGVAAVPVDRTFSGIPILVVSAAADVRNFKVNPSQVEVTVRGEGELVKDLRANEIQALVDLTGVESARGFHKRIEISTPPGITHVQVVPDEVDVIVPPKR